MEKQELEVQRRGRTGKGVARKLRAKGFIPAVCYRKGIQPIPLSLEKRNMDKLLQSAEGQSILIQLKIKGESGPGEEESVILKEIQKNHLSEVLHVDFLGVKMDEAIVVEVPLRLIGEPTEALQDGGMVQQLKRVLEVECLPGDIPENLEADISELKIGDSLHVEEIQVLEGIRVLTDGKEPVVVISAPVAEVEEEKEEEAEEDEAAEGDEKETEKDKDKEKSGEDAS